MHSRNIFKRLQEPRKLPGLSNLWSIPGCLSIFVLLFLLVSSLTGTEVFAQEPEETLLYQEDFENGEATGWELEPGWGVIQEGNNHVLAGEGHAWAYSRFQTVNQSRILYRLKLTRGSVHLVVRLNKNGRYFIGFHEGGSNLNKQYWPDTFIDNLAGSSTYHTPGAWHQIEIDAYGNNLRFMVDGVLEWEYNDPEALTYGSFALETLDGSQAYVDDIQVFGPAPVSASAGDTDLNWVRTGGPLGGLGYDVRMRADNPDIMYVSDAFAGVFVSSDGGLKWHPSNKGITTRTGTSGDAIPVFCLTIDPHDQDIIWAGTQNVRGIFKSIDGGQTWIRMDNGVVENEGITFRGITIDPRTSDIVYAAAELSSYVWNGAPRSGREFDMTAGVVYKTIDGGKNWQPIWRGENLARYIWINPLNPDVIYISTGIFDREAANSDPQEGLPGGEGVLKSTDGGQTWEHANNGLENLYVGTLYMHPENPDILLAGTGNNQYHQNNGVYLTQDGGISWQHVLAGDNINAVEFADSDPQIAYAGSAGAVYRSKDGGHNWQTVSSGKSGWGSTGVRAGFPIDFQVDPRDPQRIFANEYGGGNFLSTDGGSSWVVASSGYTGAQVRDIAVDPASGRVYAAARSGIFMSADGGSNWSGLNSPPAYSMEWYVVSIDPTDSHHILAANNWNGIILVSRDGGEKWRIVGAQAGENMSWRAIAFAPSDPSMVYAGTSAFFSAGTFDNLLPAAGISVSHDGGETWSPANDSVSQDANVCDLAVVEDNPQVVYAATGNNGMLKSVDGGGSWATINQGIPGSPQALAVAVNPDDANILYAGLAFGGLYRSVDGGQTWEPSAAGLNPEASISDILFDPTNPEIMYAADVFSGVYQSTNGGTDWLPLNAGLRTRAVNKMAFSSDGAHLYAATEGEGVFRLDLSGEPPQPIIVPTQPEPTQAAQISEAPATVTSQPPATTPPATPQPTTAPGSSKLCGGIFALPIALAGLVVFRRGRK